MKFKSLLALAFLLPLQAFSWGHFPHIDRDWWYQSLLIHDLDKGQINYCVRSASKEFDLQGLKLQTTKAIRVWLEEMNPHLVNEIQLSYVQCGSHSLDLMVTVEDADPDIPAYFIPEYDNGDLFSKVVINTEFRSGKYSIIDTKKLTPDGMSFEAFLNRLTTVDTSINDLVSDSIDETQAFNTSFPTLVHEMGHAFGLCDMYSPAYKHCDSSFSSKKRPNNTVMNDATFHRPQKDDIRGIRQLYQRYY